MRDGGNEREGKKNNVWGDRFWSGKGHGKTEWLTQEQRLHLISIN